MSTLRSLRLLGAVEAGTVNGSQLQTYLTDAGRSSEFSVLLSSRGQSRRMASSPLTMTAITTSAAAINIVFQSATTATAAACQAVVVSAVAMNSVSNSTTSLNVVGANPVAWSLFNTSPYYETNVRTVLALYAGVTPSVYPTVTSLIVDPVAMADIAAAPYAMSAVVASPTTTAIMATSSVAMALVAANPVAIGIVAAQTSIMGTIANSPVAMTEIISRAPATALVAAQPGAINAVAGVPSAWASYMGGPYFSTNLATALANLIGVNPSAFPSLSSIIANASALALVAKNTSAVQALASNNTALTTLASSPNIGIILGSATAMAVIGPNSTAMSTFLGASGAWAGLFSSSIAKGYIVSTTALVDAVAGNSALISYLTGLSAVTQPTGVPDGVVGAFQAFTGLTASKVLILAVKEVGIAATFSDYNLRGSPQAGTAAGATLHVSSTAWTTHVAGYTGLTWDFQGIGITAATLPIIRYVDMS